MRQDTQTLESPIESATTVTAEEYVYFHCSQCGECCTSVSMPVDLDKAKYLNQQPWFQQQLAEYNAKLMPLDEGFLRLPLKPDQSCVFLDEDNRCLIEAHEGKDWKPTECRRFPFASILTDTGSRLYDTSAGCKTVSEELLTSFLPVLPLPENPPPDSGELTLSKTLQVSGWQHIPSEQWLGDTAWLRAIFTQGDMPEMALQKACQSWSPSRKHKLMPPQQEGPEQTCRADLENWNTWADWLVLLYARKPYGLNSLWELWQGQQYTEPKVFGHPIALPPKDWQRAWLCDDPESTHLLNGFLFHLLQRRVLLAHGFSIRQLFGLACIANALVQWHARILAFQENRNPENQDLVLAIRLVERYYTGHQPHFLHRLRQDWLVSKLPKLIFRQAQS